MNPASRPTVAPSTDPIRPVDHRAADADLRRRVEHLEQALEESRAELRRLVDEVSRLRGTASPGLASGVSEYIWRAARFVDRHLPVSETTRERAFRTFFRLYGSVFPRSARYEEYLRFCGTRPPRRKVEAADVPILPDAGGPRAFDVFVFPVIDWNFRHQRPQQLALQLARQGHRVFYFTTTFQPLDQYEPTPIEVASGVYQITLPCVGTFPIIYEHRLTDVQLQAVLDGLDAIRQQFNVPATVSIVDHPFWWPVAHALSNNRVVYDCMDHHAGFSNTASHMLELEEAMVAGADLVVTSSDRLFGFHAPQSRRTALIRNGTDFDHFAAVADEPAGNARPQIGYYGAIAEWFDASLVAAAARSLPDCDFVLVGATAGADLTALDGLANVRLTGEIPYRELPQYARHFDVCMIPFKVNELTLNTNPVKVYEYLTMGKPVVAVRLPELEACREVVSLADTPEDFCDQLRLALDARSPAEVEKRRAYARQHTWEIRGNDLAGHIGALFPKVSVVVLTYNGLDFTRACLASLERFTDYPDWELVLVDNASADGTPDYLKAFATSREHVRLVLNDANLGFAGGNNAGARAASGDYLVFLNNDTFVTRGWLADLVHHFPRRPELGLLNPITNNIGNEARVDIVYADMSEMAYASARLTRRRRHHILEMGVCAFFCVMIPRRVWDEVGELDEAFATGFFEDDDYAARARQRGYSLACAEDVFVHHHLSASFDALGAARKQELFEQNRRIFEGKWGPWVPHQYRPDPGGASR